MESRQKSIMALRWGAPICQTSFKRGIESKRPIQACVTWIPMIFNKAGEKTEWLGL